MAGGLANVLIADHDGGAVPAPPEVTDTVPARSTPFPTVSAAGAARSRRCDR